VGRKVTALSKPAIRQTYIIAVIRFSEDKSFDSTVVVVVFMTFF
jgi:hypothetical protein